MSVPYVDLSANTSLNESVLLEWVMHNCTVTTIGNVSGYITVIDTTTDESLPFDVYLSYDDINAGEYLVENLTNGVKYAFTLSIYTTDFETIVKSNIVLDTPSDIPEALTLAVIGGNDEIPYSNNGVNDVSVSIKVTIGSNGGLPIEKIYLYMVDTSNYVSTTYLYSSSDYEFLENNDCLLPINDAKLNKKYFIYGEAINESGSSKPSNRIVLDTNNKPPDATVTSVVSGLDSQLKVSVALRAESFYRLTKVSVLVWDITNSDTTNSSNWGSLTSYDFTDTDSDNQLILNNLVIDGLTNGHVYRVAAFVTNTFESGNRNTFNKLYTNTGIPAKLPTIADYNGNFSLSKVNNTNSDLSAPNGSLTVSSANNNGVTSTGHFTFDPVYDISYNSDTVVLSSLSGVSFLSTATASATGLNILVGNNYKAFITVKTSVPSGLVQYWKNDENQYSLEQIELSTIGKPSDMIVETVESGLDSKLIVSLSRAGNFASNLTSVTILLWDITLHNYTSSIPSNWSQYDMSVNLLPGAQGIDLSNIEITGLTNGHAYQVVAYSTNVLGSSYQSQFSSTQMKTGVPAIFPTLSNYVGNFTLSKMLNTSTETPNGFFAIDSLNANGLTSSGHFTFDPTYEIIIRDNNDFSLTTNSLTPFSCVLTGLDVKPGVDYYATIVVTTDVSGVLLNYWSNSLTQYVMPGLIEFNTVGRPSDMVVNNVVSGLDGKLRVSLSRLDGSNDSLNSVTILLWDITEHESDLPSDWSQYDVSTNLLPDDNGHINLNDIEIDGLVNGHAYKIVAYSTNDISTSYHSQFAPSQMKTGVPAYLPVLDDFSGIFSLSKTINTSTSISANGVLTVGSSGNDDGVTSSGYYTFDPVYEITVRNSSNSILGSDSSVSSFSYSFLNKNVELGVNYYASIKITLNVPDYLSDYWSDTVTNYTIGTVNVDTTNLPSDMVVSSVVSGLNGQLKVSLSRADGATSALDSVTILVWNISDSSVSVTKILEPVNGVIQLSDIEILGLTNGVAYKVAAYATNTNGSSLYSQFAPAQMKTGVPAYLPVLDDFSGIFSLHKTINKNTSSTGVLTVNSSGNDDGVTSSGYYTFDPVYDITVKNSSNITIGSDSSVSSFSHSFLNKNVTLGANFYASIKIIVNVPDYLSDYWSDTVTNYTIGTINVDTTNLPSDMVVSSVVSGLDGQLKVSLTRNGNATSALDSVTILAWNISDNDGVVTPDDWTTVDVAITLTGITPLNDIIVPGLTNGKAYKVAAYATNAYGSSLYSVFITGQMKTGVPAKLQTNSDYVNNFSLSRVVNTITDNSLTPNGVLTIHSNNGNGDFTFSPTYTVIVQENSNGPNVYSGAVSSMDLNISNFNVKVNVNYYVTITVNISVPDDLRSYWVTGPAKDYSLLPITINTSSMPSNMIVSSVVSGLDSKLRVSLSRADDATSDLSSVTILLWDITSHSYAATPSNWSQRDKLVTLLPDTDGHINLNNIEIDNLINGHAYQVVAYATNEYGSSFYLQFSPLQMKTGVPAILPTDVDFAGIFSLSKIVNTNALSPNGSLKVSSSGNTGGVTSANYYTFNPKYDVTIRDYNEFSVSNSDISSFDLTVSQLDVKVGRNYYATITVKTQVSDSLINYWSNNTINPITVNINTENNPSDMTVSSVTSGYDQKLIVSLHRADCATSALTSVTILLWDITLNGTTVPSDWNSANVITKNFYPDPDNNNSIILSDIVIDNLVNGHIYQVAAYATNSYGSSNYSIYASSQMKTGIPARLPDLTDFINNFSITGTLNTNSNSPYNGTLNIVSTKTASDFNNIFTFSPTYSLRIYNSDGTTETTVFENASSSSPSVKLTGRLVNSGVNYYASIIVNTQVPTNKVNFWQGTSAYTLDAITVGPLYLSTAPVTAPILVDSSVYVSPDYTESKTFGIVSEWNAPSEDGYSSILGYIVKFYNSDNNVIYKGYTNGLNASLYTSEDANNNLIVLTPFSLSGNAYVTFGVNNIVGVDYNVIDLSLINERLDVNSYYTVGIAAVNINGVGPEVKTNRIYITLPPDAVSDLSSYQLLDTNYNEMTMPALGKVNISWTSPTIAEGSGLEFVRYDIYKYNSSDLNDNTPPLLLGSSVTESFIATDISTATPFYYGVQLVTINYYETLYKSAVNRSSLIFTDVPMVTLPTTGGFSTNSSGNGVVTFYINDGGSNLIGLTVMVLPDANISTNVDPVTIIKLNNGIASIDSLSKSLTVNTTGPNSKQYVLTLDYKIPSLPSYLIVATNSAGSDVYYKNFSA